MTKTKRQPRPGLRPKNDAATPLRTTRLGSRVLVFYDSVLEALGIDPATEPADRPKTITIKQTQAMIGLGERHVFRMIAAGREQHARQSAREPHDNAAA